MDLDDHRRANLANWNDRVPIHAASQTYGLHRYAEDPAYISGVVTYDRDRLGDVGGQTEVWR